MAASIVADYRALAEELRPQRDRGATLALANGCFDVLHVGHVRLFAEAAGLADLLVVALNDDASVTAVKGAGRPHVPLAERMEIVAALAGVTHVTSFPEPTAHGLIETLRPDVYVKGTDRTPDTIPENEILASCGARLHIAGDPKSHSSSELIAKLRNARR